MRKAMKSSCPPGAELQAFGSQAARRLNPKKLLLSKWTAASPDGKEKHRAWHCDAGDPAQWMCIGCAEAPRQRCFRQPLPPGLCAYQQLRQLAGLCAYLSLIHILTEQGDAAWNGIGQGLVHRVLPDQRSNG